MCLGVTPWEETAKRPDAAMQTVKEESGQEAGQVVPSSGNGTVGAWPVTATAVMGDKGSGPFKGSAGRGRSGQEVEGRQAWECCVPPYRLPSPSAPARTWLSRSEVTPRGYWGTLGSGSQGGSPHILQ